MERAIAATNYSKGGCERIGVHLDDGSRSQNTKSNSSFWQSLSVSGCIICCHYTFFDTLRGLCKCKAPYFEIYFRDALRLFCTKQKNKK